MTELAPGRVRGSPAGLGLLASGALLWSALATPPPLLIWNRSASAPIGLYRIVPGPIPARGKWVAAHLPAPERALAARRHYVPANVPLVKRVAAGTGDTICAIGSDIVLNGSRIARRLRADRFGRPLPWWHGCVMLQSGSTFLLTSSPLSFDGRYFGPTAPNDIIGEARLIWRG